MEEQLTLLDRAILFAVKAHAGAVRRDGHTPYILHCTEAAAIAATMTQEQEVLAAAVLHDVVEDTDVTAETLKSEFGSRVALLVGAMSENKRPNLPPEDTWLVRKEETIAALEESTIWRWPSCIWPISSPISGALPGIMRNTATICGNFSIRKAGPSSPGITIGWKRRWKSCLIPMRSTSFIGCASGYLSTANKNIPQNGGLTMMSSRRIFMPIYA